MNDLVLKNFYVAEHQFLHKADFAAGPLRENSIGLKMSPNAAPVQVTQIAAWMKALRYR